MSAIYFALVTESDTTFTAGMRRMDMDILHAKRSLKEGDAPILELEVRNPRRGLLNGNLWCWFVYVKADETEVPLFFGRLVGLPDDLQAETINLNFIAKSNRWQLLKQASAEIVKQTDVYDPVFVEANVRDDPDAIIEAMSASYCFDPVPSGSPLDLQIRLSDMVEPEDGYVVFLEGSIFYENFKFKIGQQPLILGISRASVHWTQRAAGTVDMGTLNLGDSGPVVKVIPGGFITTNTGAGITTQSQMTKYRGTVPNINGSSSFGDTTLPVDGRIWTGGSIIDAWPKAGTSLSGGYTVAASFAIGNGAEFGSPQRHEFQWENQATNHNEGDTMSISKSWTTYPCGGHLLLYDMLNQPGLVDPLASTTPGGPQGVNIPLHVTYSETLVCSWEVNTALALDYEAARPHTETIEVRINADVQDVLTDSNNAASLDTEMENLSGSDVGMPVVNVLSWYTLFLQGGVQLGQVVKSTLEFPGQPVYSIAVSVGGGSVGSAEPDWTDELGATLVDGDVTWASLGFILPSDFPTWRNVANSQIALGTIIRAETFFSAPVDWTGIPIPAPASGTQSFQMCVQSGTTQQYSNSTFTGIGETQPNYPQPSFSATPGETTTDNTVIWVSLGDGSPVMEIPLGLNPAQSTYFPSDRGQKSLKYIVYHQRAKLRSRARAATIEWDAEFESVMDLRLTMGAQPYSDRLPGGNAQGKIVETTIEINGDATLMIGHVKIAPCIGNGGMAHAPDIEGDYGDVDWDDGYQVDIGLSEEFDENDIFYSIPQDQPDADGVVFPIVDRSAIIVKEAIIIGRPPGAPEFVPNSFIKVDTTITIPERFGGFSTTETDYVRVPVGYTSVLIPVSYTDNRTGIATTSQQPWFFPVSQYYLELKSLSDVSFAKQYVSQTSPLMLPKQIDLEASSLS